MSKENIDAYLRAVGSVFIIALVARVFFRKQVETVERLMVDRITCRD